MKHKRILSALMAAAMTFSAVQPFLAETNHLGTSVIQVQAAEIVASGECGAEGGNVTWTLDDTGLLTISGKGKMKDFEDHVAPWLSYESYVKQAVISKGITSIGSWTFSSCRYLQSVTIPDGVTSIERLAFAGCTSLQTITIPAGVTSIGVSAFDKCKNLKSITVPSSLTSIKGYAFLSCNQLTDVYYSGTKTQWNAISIESNNECLTNATIHCKEESSSEIGTITPERTIVASGECGAEGGNVTWTLDDKGKLIISGTGAMFNYFLASPLENSIYAPWKDYRDTITSVVIEKGVSTIGNRAFTACSNLSSIIIPDTVSLIGDCAFASCSKLSSVNIPYSVTQIAGGAFSFCKCLTNITIPASVTSIGDLTFFECNRLTNIIIPEGVTSIGGWSFYHCNSLTNIIIPDSVTSIEESAFDGCYEISDIYYNGTEEQWNSIDIGYNNNHLFRAKIHYNSKASNQKDNTPKVDERLKNLQDRYLDYHKALTNYYQAIGTAANDDKKKLQNSSTEDKPYIALMKWDQEQKSRLLTFPLGTSKPVIEDTYEVLYDYLITCLDTANKKHIIELNIDNSKSLPEIEVDIVKKISDAVWWGCQNPGKGTGTHGYTVDLNIFGGIFGIGAGSVTITKDNKKISGVVYCTTYDVAAKAMNQFINDLCDEVRSQYKNACFALADYFNKTTGLNQISKDILEDRLNAYTDTLLELGYGKLVKTLLVANKVYLAVNEVYTQFVNAKKDYLELEKLLSSDDKKKCKELLKTIKDAEISDDEVKNSVVKGAMEQLENTRKKLDSALYDYIYDADTSKTGAKQDWKKILFLCPVNVEIRHAESNEIAGYIRDGELYTDGSIEVGCYGDEKYVILPKDQQFDITLTGTDEGTMQIMYQNIENGEEKEYTAFYNVPLTAGVSYTQKLDSSEMSEDLSKFPALSDADGNEISASAYYTNEEADRLVTVTVNDVEGGIVFGAGEYTKGDCVQLIATANEGYSFDGWYCDDAVVSLDALYSFPAMEDLTIAPKYEKIHTENTDFKQESKESNNDDVIMKVLNKDENTADVYVVIYKETEGDAEAKLTYRDGTTKTLKLQSEDGVHYIISEISLADLESIELYDGSESELAALQKNNTLAGDMNGDGSVNLKDAVLLRRYIAGGWNVELDESVADVNSDNAVNLKDVVLIRRYIAGGWNVELNQKNT